MPISFGDNVKVVTNPQTSEKGLAGRIGAVFGETTPSVTSVEVIGEIKDDYAINVHFEELGNSFWFAPEILEFVDHGVGAEITLDGVSLKWTRNSDGGWDEENLTQPKNSWWKFW